MNNEKLNELLNSKTEENATDIIIEIFDAVAALIENDDLKELSEPQKNFYFNQVFEMEINNGGFSQYFLNNGQYAHETVHSLKAIGAEKTADLLQKAINKFPKSKVPKDWDERCNRLEKIEDKDDEIWDKFDDKFYDYEDNLNELNLNYIRENIDIW
ncbi:hypothetical protein FACS189434_10190 [Bacteroidia bacterium]|nr:hypothetical protein FACS189434_10190 [Bacteroidia bacterium]